MNEPDTPRTNSECENDFMVNYDAKPPEFYVSAEFAQTLERELNEALREINQIKDDADNAGMERDLQD